MNLQSEIETYSQELQNSLSSKGEQIKATLIDLERSCFSVAGNDSDRFVTCMSEGARTLQKEENVLELRSAFFQARAGECIMNSNGNADEIKKCKDIAISNIQNSFDDFINKIKF